MTAATAALTRAEDAYAHLASFQCGDLVNVQGRQIAFPAVVMTPQRHDWSDINRAYLVVSNEGTEVRITVGTLLAGQHAITHRADAGNVRYFDRARYVAQTS